MDSSELYGYAKQLGVPLDLLQKTAKLGRLPVVNFAAGGLGKYNTVFLLKIRHENNNIALASPNFWRLTFNVLSACAFHSRL